MQTLNICFVTHIDKYNVMKLLDFSFCYVFQTVYLKVYYILADI